MPAGRWSRTVGTSFETDFEIRRGEKSEHVPLPYAWLRGLGGGRRWVEFLSLRSVPQYQLSNLSRAASKADVPWAPRRRAEKVCVWRGCQGDGEVPGSEATSLDSFADFALKNLCCIRISRTSFVNKAISSPTGHDQTWRDDAVRWVSPTVAKESGLWLDAMSSMQNWDLLGH